MSSRMEAQLDESLLNDINNSTLAGPTEQTQRSVGSQNSSELATPPESANVNFNTNSNTTAILSPPGSRYAFNDSGNPISPLLTTTDNPYSGVFHNNSTNFNSLQRPLSAQDFNLGYGADNSTLGSGNIQNSSGFDAFRPFSAQGAFTNGMSSIDDAFNIDSTASLTGNNNLSSVQPAFNIPERPLSSMEMDSISFKNDVANFISWVNTLNSTQHRVVVDNLLSNLPNEILEYTRISLGNSNGSNYPYGNEAIGSTTKIFAPQPKYQSNEPITLDSVLNGSSNNNNNNSNIAQPQQTENLQRVLSPNFPTYDRTAVLQDIGFNRPRSADPYHSRLLRSNQQQQQQQQQSQQLSSHLQTPQSFQTPSKSRSSNKFDDENTKPQHYDSNNNNNNNKNNSFDITNLAQQLTQTTLNYNDFNNANNLKLSALSTINSRAQLDSNRKRGGGLGNGFSQDERGRTIQTGQQQGNFHNNYLQDDFNVRNSSSVPPLPRVSYYDTLSNSSNLKHYNSSLSPPPQQRVRQNNNNGLNSINDKDALSKIASINSATKLQDNIGEFRTPHKTNANISTAQTPKSPAINPKQLTNPKLLNDISAWLKSLRLHKYTSALQDVPWKELVYLSDKQLEDKGVTALGARGKLLKAFDVVREAYEAGEIKE